MTTDQVRQQAIGIFGGTFDPIHLGHLRTALELQQILNFAKIHMIPCHMPVHKQGTHANAQQRFAMVSLATAEEADLLADSREIDRPAPSYMMDTLEDLREELPNTPLCLILGTDAFLRLPTWHRWEELLSLCHIVVALRPGYEFDATDAVAPLLTAHQLADSQDLHEKLAGGIFLQTITGLDISATAIRSQLEAGYNPRYLLPESVLSYIKQHNLYKQP